MIKKIVLTAFLLLLIACDESSKAQPLSPEQESGAKPSLSGAQSLEKSLTDLAARTGLKIRQPWTGDLDVMAEKRTIRVLTVYGLGRYYMDGPQEKGMTYEWFKMFEDYINEKKGTKHLRIHVVVIPVARDQLIPGLISGRGDIAAAGLTITPERADVIDFSNPVSQEISEVLVTGPSSPKIATIDDLAGQEIFVRASSSYRSSLDALNVSFGQKGLAKIEIRDAPAQLEDEDLLEMVNTGMLEWAVVDDYKAKIWADVFANLTVHDELVFRSGGQIGFAMRKNSPQLAGVLNEFLKTHKQGTLKGNILINRYLKDFDWAKNALAADDYRRFQDVADIFLKYGEEYGIDYLMAAAQGFQESRLDQAARSQAGAIGIMQLLPSTAADSNVGIPDISTAEPNIHAGVKYLDFIRKRYFSDPEMDVFNQTMFAFAAYNAGPARVRKLRDSAVEQGYDPNVWFGNVEVMAAADIGSETVQYVANILKYYFAYSLSMQKHLEREQAREDAGIK
ncbi:MAG: lytic transglycosylase F [Lysobacterales bacterium]